MPKVHVSRRTGPLTAGVLPPPGIPLPVHSVGMATWEGTAGDLRTNPELLQQLVRISKVRRELRLGHLVQAGRLARGVDTGVLNQAPEETRRAIGVLHAVDSAREPESDDTEAERRAEQLQGALETLRSIGDLPDTLLDVLLGPQSPLALETVRTLWGADAAKPDCATRIAVLHVRRVGFTHLQQQDGSSRVELSRALAAAQALKLSPLLKEWCSYVERGADHPALLRKVLNALESNLALTARANEPLHRACRRLYDSFATNTEKVLARLTFGAWCTLAEVADARRPPELVIFSGQFVAFRQVFEVLLDRAIMRPFLASEPPVKRNGLVEALIEQKTTLGLGTWKSMLFGRESGSAKSLRVNLQRWFADNPSYAALRKDGLLEQGLNELLRVQLNALPHEEALARTTWREVFEVIRRVGFGVLRADAVPSRGKGLVGALVTTARAVG